MTLEPSIAPHLRRERTQSSPRPAGFTPPYPSYSARFGPQVQRVVMAYLGVQYASPEMPSVVAEALRELAAAAGSGADTPVHWDRASYVDHAGYRTVLTTLYWLDVEAWQRWRRAFAGWTDPARHTPEAGFFSEVVTPSQHRFETLLSSDRPEGIAAASSGRSGEILEHAYWGGARDRLPVAQTDRLEPRGSLSVQQDGPLVRVRAHDNLCLIRSGQDWTDTRDQEREMYLRDVEPVLRSGMDFLRDEGLAVGCLVNRYARAHGPDGKDVDKSYGMSWWRGLADLERWAEDHPTHQAIFGAALQYLSTLGPAARLRLYHEITVATADELELEYLGCHDATGVLRTH